MALKLVRLDAAGHARYQAVKQLARTQQRILEGAPGMLKRRLRRGTEYWVREFNGTGRGKADEHLGTVTNTSEERLQQARDEIALAKSLMAGSSALRVFGYQRADREPAAVLAALYNHGLFQAGLTLVGSHAYGAMVNDYGTASPAYATEDIDVARRQPLEIALPADTGLQQVLNDSGLEFVPVPGLPSRQPSGSFKVRGASALSVDLLVPGKTLGKIVAVDELRAHAQEVPLLDFLVTDPIDSIVLAPNHVIPVKIPAPERFVLHKLLSSQSRKTDREKIAKDLEQAAILAAAIERDSPGLVEDTYATFPKAARSGVRRGATAAARMLPDDQPGTAALRKIAAR
jgi:hypothetical protein